MDWTKEPPKDEELKSGSWASAPPTKEELSGHLSLGEPEKSGIGQTALEHFGNGIALGHLPHIQAAAERGVELAGDAKDKALQMVGLDHLTSLDHQLREQGFKLPDESYLAARDANIKRLAKEKKDNPLTAGVSGLAGSVVGGIAASPLLPGQAATIPLRLKNAAMVGAGAGLLANPGDTEGEVSPVQLQDRAINGAIGAGTGLAVQGAAEGISKAAPFISDNARKAGLWLKGKAKKATLNATGATGKQMSQFPEDAATELHNRRLVRFGDSQEKIAQRVGEAAKAANADIDSSLTALQDKGVKVDANKVYNTISEKIKSLKGDPSQADVVRNLEGELENLINATDSKGSTDFGIKEAEQIKRGYNRKAGNWADPEKGQAGKEMYQNFRGAVEDAAQAADPATAKVFEEGKKTYGLLAPIKEAAERRAATTAQSPPGGFLDTAAAAAGFAAGGPGGGIAAPLARRFISPRISSAASASGHGVADFLMKSPQLSGLAERNPQAFNAMAVDFARKVNPSGAISKVAGPGQEPVTDDEAKQKFVDGN